MINLSIQEVLHLLCDADWRRRYSRFAEAIDLKIDQVSDKDVIEQAVEAMEAAVV